MHLEDPSLLRNQCLINGQWTGGESGRTLAIHNPATGERITTVPDLGARETTQAIAAANAAWPAWRARSAKERAIILRRWFDLMVAHTADLALIMTCEQGKPLAEAKGEIAYAGGFVEWFGEEAKRVYGDTIPAPTADRRIIAIKQPVGVCAVITPWNFPAAMITRKVGPALAAGCTVVAKPAKQTPLTALALAELAQRAGVPAGVLNVLTGSASAIGGVLTASPIVRKLSFTGSTEAGRMLMAQCAGTVKRLSLELGGHAPFIVFDDADLEAAVDGAMGSKYRNMGQTCICPNRFLVQEGVYEAFARKLVERVRALRVGNGLEAGAEQGPLIDEAAVQKVEQHVADAAAKGGRILCGGKRHALGRTFYEPTVIGDATPTMLCAQEETFGPVAPLFRFQTDEQAIALANDTIYGLAAYLYSRGLVRAWRAAEQLEYGMVGVNSGVISNEMAPFGGVKQSGLGREGGKYGMEEYLEIKYLNIGGMGQ